MLSANTYIYCVPDTILNVLYMSTHLILTRIAHQLLFSGGKWVLNNLPKATQLAS